MIRATALLHFLLQQHIDFFAGVPDSTLKVLCALLSQAGAGAANTTAHHAACANSDVFADAEQALLSQSQPHTSSAWRYLITANEGNAVALCAGHYLATGRAGCVFMQNSGLGNCVNPLLSLNDKQVFAIPVLLLVGWRGAPHMADEPQHVKQGQVTLELLECMGISYVVVSPETTEEQLWPQLSAVLKQMQQESKPVAVVIKPQSLAHEVVAASDSSTPVRTLEKMAVIASLVPLIDAQQGRIFASTGHIARELYQVRCQQAQPKQRLSQEQYSPGLPVRSTATTATGAALSIGTDICSVHHEHDFYCVGSMGHLSSLALGYALEKPQQPVFVLDGDGALLMHLGALYVIGAAAPQNFYHLVFDNAAHDSVGGQAIASERIDYEKLALSLGYRQAFTVTVAEQLEPTFKRMVASTGPCLLVIKVGKGAPRDLMRPDLPMQQLKLLFMAAGC